MKLIKTGRWEDASPASEAALTMAARYDRGARCPALIDAPVSAAEGLGSTVCAVIGAGSIGQRVVDNSARSGIGEIRICDPGRSKPESLLTHDLRPDEIGLPKARVAAQRAIELSPSARVRFFEGRFEAMSLDALVGVDFVVIATDRLDVEVAVTQACVRLGITLIQASVYGAALVAQVRTLPADADGVGSCLACQFRERDWRDLDAGTRFSCDGSGERLADRLQAPTMSMPHLCAMSASLAVGEALRQVLRLGRRGGTAGAADVGVRDAGADVGFGFSPAEDDRAGGSTRPLAPGLEGVAEPASILTYCGYHGGTTRTPLRRNPECVVEHARWSLHRAADSVTTLCVRDFARIVGESDLRRISLRVDGYRFSSLIACACATHPSLSRFQPDDEPLVSRCSDCGEHAELHPLHSYSDVPGAVLVDVADRPLAELGVADSASVLVRSSHGATLVLPRVDERIAAEAEGQLEIAVSVAVEVEVEEAIESVERVMPVHSDWAQSERFEEEAG